MELQKFHKTIIDKIKMFSKIVEYNKAKKHNKTSKLCRNHKFELLYLMIKFKILTYKSFLNLPDLEINKI